MCRARWPARWRQRPSCAPASGRCGVRLHARCARRVRGSPPQARAKGMGRLLMEHAEALIFRDSPNVFLFVSDFNAPARAFYERLGYRQAGELPDFLIAGRSEVLMRKTRGPIRGYAKNVPRKNVP